MGSCHGRHRIASAARVRRLLGAKPPATAASSAWIVALLTAVMVSGLASPAGSAGVPVEFIEGKEQPPPAHVAADAPIMAATPDSPTLDGSAQSAERAMQRAMADQERALVAAARAVERAQQAELARESRGASAEARQLAREAMRQLTR
jgi:hypothetical protein